MLWRAICSTTPRTVLSPRKIVAEKIITHRFIHLPTRIRCMPLKSPSSPNFCRRTNFLGTTVFLRHNSTAGTESLPEIPEPPPVPDVTEPAMMLHANGDPTFLSVGLGGWTPVGLMQHLLEFMHINLSLPWWGAILALNVTVRLILFPLFVYGQRMHVHMYNHAPETSKLTKKMLQAQMGGNMYDAVTYQHQLKHYKDKHNISIFKQTLAPVIQGGTLLVSFLSLRSLANAPIESLKTGGLWWFADLTSTDPFYLLPIAVTVSMSIITEITLASNAQNMGKMVYILRASPLLFFYFMTQFCSAITFNILISNTISIIQLGAVQLPVVQRALKIPEKRKDGQVVNIMEEYTKRAETAKMQKQIKKIENAQESLFFKAASDPIPKTYKYNPTKIAEQIRSGRVKNTKEETVKLRNTGRQ